MRFDVLVVLGFVVWTRGVLAIGQAPCVAFKSSSTTFPIVDVGKKATPILVSQDDWPGVQRAASDFAEDIQRVTGVKPALTNVTLSSNSSIAFESTSSRVIIVGTLGKSSLIEEVVNRTGLDVSGVRGQWEAFVAREVKNPIEGVGSAYVIVGADKRGTIFGMYDHSEQFGVSPWYWWADVPTTQHTELHVTSSGCSHGSPSVKYRGIFLNDEQPALTNWAMKEFTNGTGAALTGSPFMSAFYTRLFELLLRMKANYLWPAQWSSAFNVDDSLNQPLADLYGIVMGTSHEEPMMRSIPVEWGLFGNGAWDYTTNSDFIYNFWINGTERAKPYESLYTIGMRGNGDLPLSESINVALLEKIVSDQRQIFGQVFNGTDVTTIPQVWALYQEVQGYYEDGMRVPDDVTLLWTDDTWGNIRRFPLISERNRTGGAGVYYHFDLVGPPRDYKWITTYEQMSLAIARKADRIWIVNVGDLKPYELDTEFFITMGWDASVWTPYNLDGFVSSWAKREFDLPDGDSEEVAGIIANLTRFTARRKPELLNSTTYSFTNYREADNALAELKTISDSSTRIYDGLSSEKKAAFFQLVQHPVQATYVLANMWMSSGINNLRASQARISANTFADQVEDLFEQDFALETQYHQLLNGKWDHMMDQTHVMYYYWQQPMANTMPPVVRVQAKKQALPGPMRISPEGSLAAWQLPGIGRTLSGITPWPRGGDEQNFTAGTGPSVEYDFFTFNTVGNKGTVNIVTYLSPTWNANGQDRPVAFAVQIDSQAPQTNHFFPLSAPGSSPAAWNGYDGFVANSIITTNNAFTVPPGAHTLKIWMVEPTVIVQKIVINTGGVRASYLGPPESLRM
ncbi:hypothetical protein NLI96_g361 [Meripilus lineatus]|uniref:Gylcosyl hydrolase 115 C-terminal domain-containing protein n=1 Tax=Meripilus lineatus TaxID=2056292 RepID=A0AAD5YM27_9APHY|nr:hypothetical protein NLI96_g361 [Physisporinus lineatus]